MSPLLLALALTAFQSPPDSSLSHRIDTFIEPYVSAHLWSGAVLVARGDSILHTSGYGWADAEHRVPNRPDTRFAVASVTKAFTRTATARLWQADVLSPDDPLRKFIPDFPGGGEITIRHLVEHRSGIQDTDALPWFQTGQRFHHSLGELVDSLAAVPLEFDPGTAYSYSNGGYTVLARVLEVATGLPFPDVLSRWVFEPAGMIRSGDHADGALVQDRAKGYVLTQDGDGLYPGPPVHPSNKVGAGSAYTTVKDLDSFRRALRDERLLPAALRDSLFGTEESPVGVPRVFLGGRGPSYTAAVQIFAHDDLMVVALGNNYGRLNEEISDGIVALVQGQWEDDRIEAILDRTLPFEESPIPEGTTEQLVGNYRHQWGFDFSIEAGKDGGLVYVDLEHETHTPLLHVGAGRWISPFQWAEIRTEPDGIGWIWLDYPDREWAVERRND